MWYGTPKYRRWTQGAAECYARGCVCKDCPTFELIGKECKMKRAVLRLVQDYGIPPDDFKIEPKFNNVIEVKADFCTAFMPDSDGIEPTEQSSSGVTSGAWKKSKTEKEKQMFDESLNLRYGNSLQLLIEAIKKGYESYEDLTKYTHKGANLLAVNFADFHKYLIKHNLITDNKDITKKEAVINFVKRRLQNKNYTEVKEIQCESAQETSLEDTLRERCNNLLERLEQSQKENEDLRKKITELENKPQKTFDFDIIKHELINQIEQLKTKLKAVELLETEFAPVEFSAKTLTSLS